MELISTRWFWIPFYLWILAVVIHKKYLAIWAGISSDLDSNDWSQRSDCFRIAQTPYR